MRPRRVAVLVLLGVLPLLAASTAVSAAPDTGGGETRLAAAQPELESSYGRAAAVVDGQKLVSVLIMSTEDPVASYDGGIAGYAPTSPRATGKPELDANAAEVVHYRGYLAKKNAQLESQLEAVLPVAQVTEQFDVAFAGVAALVPPDELATVAALPGVAGVYLDELQQLDTERSPQFIGADLLWAAQGGQEQAGEGVVVGILDSGIWPEHPSMSDPDPSGKPYPAPPTGPLPCEFGNTAWNPNDAPFTCNNKLIGAYEFLDTYKAVVGLLPAEFDSARDDNGHGTHTTTTAAGNGGVEAALLGVSRGYVSGVAPRAHVIAYRVCGDQGCYNSDSIAAMGQAILDGVDVVNFSIGGGGSPYSDPVSLAFLAAYDAGILVTPSAGNSGPGADTVGHREPWTLTVGASTSDRHFLSTVTLSATGGDMLELSGASITGGIATPTPVVTPGTDPLCLNPFTPGTFSGEIVVCQRGINARVAKSYNVAAGGAGGMLLFNPTLQGLSTDSHFIPSVHFEYDAGAQLLAFLAAHTGVTATFTDGTATTVQGDVMAAFSSRGGPNQPLGISKPDVTAPGVQILAGHTPLPATIEGGLPGQLFQAIQGTSMSAPHVAGAAALLKASHPDWTPGQIKSALMMSALTMGVTKEDGITPADPFDMGSGRIRPYDAAMVGLTISDSAASYVAMADHLWDANYPSLYVPALAGQISVQRTLVNEQAATATWKLSVAAPPDLKVSVPKNVVLSPSGSATITITVDGRMVPFGETRHAMVTMLEKKTGQQLVFPVTIVRRQGAVTVDKTCADAEIPLYGTTSCSISVTNTTFADVDVTITDRLPAQIRLDKASVTGATWVNARTLTTAETLTGAAPPIVTIDAGTSPAGYLPLSLFGVAPIGGVGDESIVNFSVPGFEFAGEVWDRIGIVSNGYAVVGGGTGADVEYVNQLLPDAAPPNNVLAPFWTDLNPAAGGALRVALLTDGADTWLVLEWEAVKNFSDGQPNSFQIWIGTAGDANPGEDITFTYGPVTGGDLGFLTVGAENRYGSSGESWYYNGTGTAPAAGTELRVSSVPGTPGETYVVTFGVVGTQVGSYVNYAVVSTDAVPGDAIDGFAGRVTAT